MVARITLAKKEPPRNPEQLQEAVKKGEELRLKLLKLVVDDTDAFNAVLTAIKLPKEDAETRRKSIQMATVRAAEVPLSTMENSVQVLRLARSVAEQGATNALSDVTTAAAAARAGVEGAASNVLINLGSLEDKRLAEKLAKQVADFQKEALALEEQVSKVRVSRSR